MRLAGNRDKLRNRIMSYKASAPNVGIEQALATSSRIVFNIRYGYKAPTVPIIRRDALSRAESKLRRQNVAALALRVLDRKAECSRLHSQLVQEYEQSYGMRGPIISGVHQDHWPVVVKDRLRRLALAASTHHALLLWLAAGKTLRTYRAQHDRRSFGYYG